jgi:hypothetical protein
LEGIDLRGAVMKRSIIALSGVLAVGILGLVACGGGSDDTKSSKSPIPAAAPSSEGRLPWAPPTANGVVGTWSQVGDTLVARFRRDRTFAFDNDANWESPAAVGRYELDGETMRFTNGRSAYCAQNDTWVWEVGLDTGTRDDLLHVRFVKGGCNVKTGSMWTFARVGP